MIGIINNFLGFIICNIRSRNSEVVLNFMMFQIFRTLRDIEYECLVEVVTSGQQFMLVVVRYPNALSANCEVNRDAFTVLKRRRCVRLCDLLYREVYSNYFIFSVKDRLRFLFKSNSSINTDINVSKNLYNVSYLSSVLRKKVSESRLKPVLVCGCDILFN